MSQKDKTPINDFTIAELEAWEPNVDIYFVEVLNGEKSIETAREDLASYRNSEWYEGDNPKYQKIKGDI